MFTLTLTTGRRLFVLSIRDRMTTEDGRQALLALLDHPEFEPTIQVLVDIRQVTEIAADFKSIFAVVQVLKTRMGRFDRGTRFVVMTGEGASFGMARMLQQVVDVITQLRMTVVATGAEACKVLDLTEEDLEDLVAGRRTELADKAFG